MNRKPSTQAGKAVIYVDVDDEITSIIDKVETADQKVVALVLPKRASSLQSTVNMKLLARSAKNAGKNPVLITSESTLLPLAGAAGLHVARNLQSKPEVPESPPGYDTTEGNSAIDTDGLSEEDLPGKIDYSSTVGALAAVHAADNPETIDLEDETESTAAAVPLKTKDKTARVPNFDKFRLLLGLGIAGLIALIVFLVFAIKVLPKATITLKTSSEPVSANFDLKASAAVTELNNAKAQLPAKLESADQIGTQTVNATGQQNTGEKATGNLTFSIPCSSVSGSPPTIPAGTGVTANGLGYITQSSSSLTNPSFTGGCHFNGSTTITAVSAGAKFNIGDSSFTISGSGYSNVSGSGSASGGTDNIVTVLTQSDVDGAKQKLTIGTTGDQFAKDFQKKLSDQGEYVLTSTLKNGEANITATPAVGQPASTSSVTIKINYTVLSVKKSDLRQAIEEKLSGQIDKSKQKLNGNFLEDADITVRDQNGSGAATLGVSENTTAVPIINITSVKKQVEGKKSGDIKAALGAWAGVKQVDVKLSPFWVSKAPTKDSKIKVLLQEVKASSTDSGQP